MEGSRLGGRVVDEVREVVVGRRKRKEKENSKR